jgi:hypothetical protein
LQTRPFQRGQDARDLVGPGQTVVHRRGVADCHDRALVEVVDDDVGSEVDVNAIEAAVGAALPQDGVGGGAQVVGFGPPVGCVLAPAGRIVQPGQPLQRGVRDRLVVDRGRPLVTGRQVRGIVAGLPFDVAPIGGVAAFDQSRVGVAAVGQQPGHRAVQPIDQGLSA